MDTAENEKNIKRKGAVMKELALHIMDIIQNSLTAGSSNITVDVCTCNEDRFLDIVVSDDGCGMDEKTMKKLLTRFIHRGKRETWDWEYPCSKKLPPYRTEIFQ